MIAPVVSMAAAQLWLFSDAAHESARPSRLCVAPFRVGLPSPRRRRTIQGNLFPQIAAFIERESRSPEMRMLLGDEDQPAATTEMTRKEKIELRNDLRDQRRDQRRSLPHEVKSILRADELSCEVLESLDDWIGTGDKKWMAWLDRWIAEGAAQVRSLWSRAEERNRRLGITANELDPNEHVLPQLVEVIGDLGRLDLRSGD